MLSDVCRVHPVGGRRVLSAGWMADWARPGSRLPLRTSVAGLGGGISWRPPTQLVYVGHSAAVHICGPNAGRQMVIAWSKSS